MNILIWDRRSKPKAISLRRRRASIFLVVQGILEGREAKRENNNFKVLYIPYHLSKRLDEVIANGVNTKEDKAETKETISPVCEVLYPNMACRAVTPYGNQHSK